MAFKQRGRRAKGHNWQLCSVHNVSKVTFSQSCSVHNWLTVAFGGCLAVRDSLSMPFDRCPGVHNRLGVTFGRSHTVMDPLEVASGVSPRVHNAPKRAFLGAVASGARSKSGIWRVWLRAALAKGDPQGVMHFW